MMGQESQGMLLSAVHKENGEEVLHLLMLDDGIPPARSCADSCFSGVWLSQTAGFL